MRHERILRQQDDGEVIREVCFNDIFDVPFFDTAEKAEAYIPSSILAIFTSKGFLERKTCPRLARSGTRLQKPGARMPCTAWE